MNGNSNLSRISLGKLKDLNINTSKKMPPTHRSYISANQVPSISAAETTESSVKTPLQPNTGIASYSYINIDSGGADTLQSNRKAESAGVGYSKKAMVAGVLALLATGVGIGYALFAQDSDRYNAVAPDYGLSNATLTNIQNLLETTTCTNAYDIYRAVMNMIPNSLSDAIPNLITAVFDGLIHSNISECI